MTSAVHPLLHPSVTAAIGPAVVDYSGVSLADMTFRSLDERASHPCGLFRASGRPAVFAKLDQSPDGRHRLETELSGLAFLRRRGVDVPAVVSPGVTTTADGLASVLLLEGLVERPSAQRSGDDWRRMGGALAALHNIGGHRFGSPSGDGFFGPFPLLNSPVDGDRWSDFYRQRRLDPMLTLAARSGHLSTATMADLDRVMARLPELVGPEPTPSLLHGDAQQNNLVVTEDRVVMVDACPYYGHPELDLALLGYFAPVPEEVFAGYRERHPIDPGFEDRRELWRIFAYLGMVSVGGSTPFAATVGQRLDSALSRYR